MEIEESRQFDHKTELTQTTDAITEGRSDSKTTAVASKTIAMLLADNWTYYVKKRTLLLGRLLPDDRSPDTRVDVHLGENQHIANKHVILQFDHVLHEWKLFCLSEYGIVVNGKKFKESDTPITLNHCDIVDIAGIRFEFQIISHYDQSTANVGQTLSQCPSLQNFNHHHLAGTISGTSSAQSMPELVYDEDRPLYTSTRKPSLALSKNDFTTRAFPYPSRHHVRANTMVVPSISPVSPGKPKKSEKKLPFTSPTATDNDDPNVNYEKPPYPYTALIAEAILSTEDKRMTLNNIYNFLLENYPYYRKASVAWQNSVRHNLSLHRAFVKVPKPPSEGGKGMYWAISPKCLNDILKIVPRNGRSYTRSTSIYYDSIDEDEVQCDVGSSGSTSFQRQHTTTAHSVSPKRPKREIISPKTFYSSRVSTRSSSQD